MDSPPHSPNHVFDFSAVEEEFEEESGEEPEEEPEEEEEEFEEDPDEGDEEEKEIATRKVEKGGKKLVAKDKEMVEMKKQVDSWEKDFKNE
nr:hypothetical protein [Tanacetum cinerariifolium]